MPNSRGGIDYSKWDKFDAGSSDDDDAPADAVTPRVTTLTEPGTVTRSPDGQLSFSPGGKESARTATTPSAPVAARDDSLQHETAGRKLILTKNGGEFVDAITDTRVRWSQDRHEVIISVAYDPDLIKPKNMSVKLTGALPYSERFTAVGGEDAFKGSLTVSAKFPATGDETKEACHTLLSGELPHFVHLAEDEDDVEWEIDTCEYYGMDRSDYGKASKLIRVTLRKAVPMAGMSIWWNRPLSNCPEIDVNSIEGRQKSSQQQNEIKSSWDEAHRLFREKVRSREPKRIHLEKESDSD